ncbi:cytochrome c-type biogenesis protein CcmH [Polyangium sp. 15x6]|uniref:cytochrome c-type biogenesis protein n=1 Tax=Polyangium sp. 15x6 TaxID=3042687 RepID=UPI00249BD15E|nr:cytochrome c-type biogenesis protein CcmH [Polyangium sp. 15x6]MDI3289789.1 cytochrome c-type biogenesis protein CcmH [Polyangium sp. 15x6]
MTTRRTPLHLALLTAAGLAAAWLTFDPHLAHGQHTGGTGTVSIQNETERQLFWSLICTCGCPRETLGTCPCDIAHQRRSALRELLAEGKTVEQAQDVYVSQYGPKSLAVPRNQGASRALWVVPITAIVAGAGLVFVMLRRWQRRGLAAAAAAPAGKKTQAKNEARDAYDDRLDQELKDLDDE